MDRGNIENRSESQNENSNFNQRANKLRTDLEVVMENIDLTNNIIDTSIDDKSNEDMLPEMILTLEALNQKMNKLVEQLTDKNESNLFNAVLLIIEDINQTKERYQFLKNKKRPKPFISAYKNAESNEGEEEVIEQQKPKIPRKLDEEEEEENQAYNQFQFNDEDDEDDDVKDNRDLGRKPNNVPQPISRVDHQPTNRDNFFNNNEDAMFFESKQQEKNQQKKQEQYTIPQPQHPPTKKIQQEPEIDLLGSDAPAKRPTSNTQDLLEISHPVSTPTPYNQNNMYNMQPLYPNMNNPYNHVMPNQQQSILLTTQ